MAKTGKNSESGSLPCPCGNVKRQRSAVEIYGDAILEPRIATAPILIEVGHSLR
jgi:hypothetical protein